MKKYLLKKIVGLSLLLSISLGAFTQSYKPFWDEIRAFKKQDSMHMPPKHAILFVGSSSFRKWTSVSTAFPEYTIINRGFGGSVLPDVTGYASDIIYPYHAKQIVIYCGDNDLAASDTITPEIVLKRFKDLYSTIRSKYKKTNILFVSIKPSPSRRNLMPAIVQSNTLIKNFLAAKKHTAFADVYNPMLNEHGQPKPYIFLSDSLHMNEQGYAIWQKIIKPYLIKN